jgi:hypothetical protein
MAGRDPIQNPHRAALLAFREHPHLLKGRVTNASFVALLRHYQAQLGGGAIIIDVVSAHN